MHLRKFLKRIKPLVDKAENLINFLRRIIFLLNSLRSSGYRELLFMRIDKQLPIIDIGANIGQTAIVFWLRGFEVYCYEPHPLAFRKLRKLFRDVRRIHTINAAIVEDSYIGNKHMNLYLHNEQISSSFDLSQSSSLLNDKSNVDNSNYVSVKVIKYSEALGHNINYSLLKCDIEGYEYFIYKDILKHKERVKYFLLETHYRKNQQWLLKHRELENEFRNTLNKSRYNLNWH